MLDVIKTGKRPNQGLCGPCAGRPVTLVFFTIGKETSCKTCAEVVGKERKIVRRKRLQSPKSFFVFIQSFIIPNMVMNMNRHVCQLHNKSSAIYGLLFYQCSCASLIVMFFCVLCSRAFIYLPCTSCLWVAIHFNIQGFSSNLWDTLLGYVTQQSQLMICTIC